MDAFEWFPRVRNLWVLCRSSMSPLHSKSVLFFFGVVTFVPKLMSFQTVGAVLVRTDISGTGRLVVGAQHQPPEEVLSSVPRRPCVLTHADVCGGARSAGA